MTFSGKILSFAYTIKVLGIFGALKHLVYSFSMNSVLKVSPKGYKYPIYLRTNTSDYPTFLQVNARKGYEMKNIEDPNVIIDCGANIGLSATFFKNRYPKSKIIAIEPEKSNFEMLLKNTKNYSNIICLNNGIWNKKCYLKILDENANKWGIQVVESSEKTEILAISIMDIIKEYDLKQIDILKIDIEGSEKYVFDEKADEWLPYVKVMIIELHDRMLPGCSEALFKILCKYKFSLDIKEDNLIFQFMK